MKNLLRRKWPLLIGAILLILAVLVIGRTLSSRETKTPIAWTITMGGYLSQDELKTLGPLVEEARKILDQTLDKGNLFGISTPEVQRLFPTVSFYLVRLNHVIAIQAGQVYSLPEDFNRLTTDTGVQVNDANAAVVAQAFIWAAHGGLLAGRIDEGGLLSFDPPRRLDETDPQLSQYHYDLEFPWIRSREKGAITNWRIGFKQGQIEIARRTLLAHYVGKYTDLTLMASSPVFDHFEPVVEYYICCNREDKFRLSAPLYSRESEPVSLPPGQFTLLWQASTGSVGNTGDTQQEKKDVLATARQMFTDKVNDDWDVLQLAPYLINLDTRQMREGPFFTATSITPSFYLLASPSSAQSIPPITYLGLLTIREHKSYVLPQEFNILLRDMGSPVTQANQEDMARAFIWVAHHKLLWFPTEGIYMTALQPIDEPDPQYPDEHYQLEIQSWMRERGVWLRWKFGFREGRITIVQFSVLGRFVGSWQSHLNPYVFDPFYGVETKTYVCCDEKGALR